MRLRLMYRLGPELKFLGNLDTMRLLARCLRRARIPFALSEGFNPHIKMSLGTVLPVGIWSEAEWLDLEVTQAWPADEVRQRLNAVAPPGLRFAAGDYIDDGAPALMSVIDSACYCFRVQGADADVLRQGLVDLKNRDNLEVRSHGKQKDRIKDLAPGLYRLEYLAQEDGDGVITAWVASGSRFNIRPDELADLFTPLLAGGRIVDCYRQGNYIKRGDNFYPPVSGIS